MVQLDISGVVKVIIFIATVISLVKWIYASYRNRVRVSYYFAISWASFLGYAFLSMGFVRIPNIYRIEEIFLLLFATSVSFAVSTMVIRNHPIYTHYLRIYVFVPWVLIIYRILYLAGYGIPGIGGITGNAGSLLILSGVITLKCFKERTERLLGISLLLLGSVCIVYKILIPWNKLFADVLLIVISLGMGLLAMWLTLAYEFKILPAGKTMDTKPWKSMTILVFEEEYSSIMRSIQSLPKLVFTRRPGLYDETCNNIYYVSNVGQEHLNCVLPTNLHRILDTALAFIKRAKEKGTVGVVVIDCLEYLKMYNEFTPVLKFLSALRDYVMLYQGILIVVVEKNAWDQKELAQLRRVLE